MNIRLNDISLSFGSVLALDNISFEVKSGERFGLIGPDGAGKTSLFRILATLLIPAKGTARLDEYDTVKDFRLLRKKIGYMPGKFSLYPDLSVEENLTFFAKVFGMDLKRNYDLIKDIYFHIEPFKNRPAGQLSGGMKQKLALCCALIHRPELLILDEPTTGVDAVSRMEFWELLKGLATFGITIMVSTPYMDEASLCQRIALIQKGKILGINTPQSLAEGFSGCLWAVTTLRTYEVLNFLEQQSECQNVYSFGDCLHLITKTEEDKIILDSKLQNVEKDAVIKSIPPETEDCFINLMQKANS